jgi:myosin heavy subunit
LAILQATGRRIVARRALKERQSIIAATSIQRFFRGSLVRQQGKNWLRAALVLQKSWRGYSTYRRYRLAILRAAMDSKACQTSSKVERRHRGDIESTLAPISETPARPTNQRLGAATTDASSQARKPMFSTRRPLGDLDMTVKTSAGSRTNARATRSRGQLKLEAYEQTLNVNRSTSRDDVEKLKVVELRDILRQRGIESKLYRNLRKAELIEMVLQNDD